MNKKVITLFLQACFLPMAMAGEQQDFLSSVSGLSLPELPEAARPLNAHPAADKFIVPDRPEFAARKVPAPAKKTVKKKPLRPVKSVASTANAAEMATLKRDVQRLEIDKQNLSQQLKQQVAASVVSPEPNPEMTAIKKQLFTSQQMNQKLQEQLKAVTAARDENQKLMLKLQQAGSQLSLTGQQQGEEVAALKIALADAQKQNQTLNEKLTIKAAVWTATGVVDKQSWALGLSLASNVRKTIVQLKDLAIPYSEEGLKQGIWAGIGMNQPPEQAVQKDLRDLLKRYDGDLQKRTNESIDLLRKSLQKQKIEKQNYSSFFVNVKKGKQVEVLEKLLFTLKTQTLDGKKVLDNVKDKPLSLDTPLPDVILEALDEIGQGGSMSLYCLGADLYTDRTLPVGIFPYTPLKITLSTR